METRSVGPRQVPARDPNGQFLRRLLSISAFMCAQVIYLTYHNNAWIIIHLIIISELLSAFYLCIYYVDFRFKMATPQRKAVATRQPPPSDSSDRVPTGDDACTGVTGVTLPRC